MTNETLDRYLASIAKIRMVVEAAKADRVTITPFNIVDLVLDNVEEITGCDDARYLIRAAGYEVKTRKV